MTGLVSAFAVMIFWELRIHATCPDAALPKCEAAMHMRPQCHVYCLVFKLSSRMHCTVPGSCLRSPSLLDTVLQLTGCAGLDGAGSVGIGCQWAFLALTLILASTLGQPAGVHVLAAGLVVSRFGLWAFDLAVSQMLQEKVSNEQLGAPFMASRRHFLPNLRAFHSL